MVSMYMSKIIHKSVLLGSSILHDMLDGRLSVICAVHEVPEYCKQFLHNPHYPMPDDTGMSHGECFTQHSKTVQPKCRQSRLVPRGGTFGCPSSRVARPRGRR